ncbi:hypothetical protein PC110_g8817 [Phytophthora cactorum]|uniref:Uncharacterized protein n=1 Tax=Phytophthora cactorum TaxID=29920 RepID=A0A329SDD6_9STRA|nr:hypothetical protein PC110_g8817 [Phytophthora cactorum]
MTFRSSGQVRGDFSPKVLNIPEAEINLWEGIHLGNFAVTIQLAYKRFGGVKSEQKASRFSVESMEIKLIALIRGGLPENFSKLNLQEYMQTMGAHITVVTEDQAVPDGHGDQRLTGETVWGLQDIRISQIGSRVRTTSALRHKNARMIIVYSLWSRTRVGWTPPAPLSVGTAQCTLNEESSSDWILAVAILTTFSSAARMKGCND